MFKIRILQSVPAKFAPALLITAAQFAPFATQAFENPDRTWAYKDWTVTQAAGQCSLTTGGDGNGFFELQFAMNGLNASATYLPIVYSNYPIPLREDDAYGLVVDGTPSWLGDEFWFFDGVDPDGRYLVGAGLTSGFVSDLVSLFRAGNMFDIVVDRSDEAPFAMDTLSLSGFSATYLKASEWCKFDPDALPSS